MNTKRKYICINCGSNVDNLCKRYSSTVLKLTDCEKCHNIADKYLEYDIVIIMIDLVLLQKQAYRHILFNADFKNFSKLFIMFLLVETYFEWMRDKQNFTNLAIRSNNNERNSTSFFFEIDLDLASSPDLQFYKTCVTVTIKTFFFLVVLYLLSHIICKFLKLPTISFIKLWKMLALSSFGTFLLLPSLIWDSRFQDLHFGIVILYTALCQLLAYSALSNASKVWCVFTICSAYYTKLFYYDFIDNILSSTLMIKNKYQDFY